MKRLACLIVAMFAVTLSTAQESQAQYYGGRGFGVGVGFSRGYGGFYRGGGFGGYSGFRSFGVPYRSSFYGGGFSRGYGGFSRGFGGCGRY